MLPPKSVVFYSFFSHDKTGRIFEYDQSAAAVAKASTAPVYGAWDFNLGYGMVGGKLISGFYQGVVAGEIALRVLRGENADTIPVVRFAANRPNRYMFDYVQLQHFGIPLSALPKDSMIENMPASYFRRHPVGTLLGAALFVILITINSLLWLNIRRRKAAERLLWDQQEHLEELVASRSVQLEDLNSRLRLDILKREAAQKALRESQQVLTQTFASLRDCLLIVSAESRIIADCNPAATQLFGYSREELIGKSVRLLHVDQEAFDKFRLLALQAIQDKGYLRIATFQMRRKDGDVFATQHMVMPLHNEEGDLTSWVSVIRDISEEKRVEEKLEQYRRKLRKLAAELTAVEARERRQIAAELHENLGQLLATAKMKIAPMKSLPGAAEVQDLVEQALQQTRSLTYQLSSPILYQLGLEAALKWLAENMAGQYGYHVAFTRLGESGSLPEESAVFLFSAVRELLVNVAKHAAASEVAVRLRWLDDCVEVLVKDNGRGFRRTGLSDFSDLKTGIAASTDGFGLFNIHERVSDLGGRVSLHSEPQRGTAVKIHLPLGRTAEVQVPAGAGRIAGESKREREYQNLIGRRSSDLAGRAAQPPGATIGHRGGGRSFGRRRRDCAGAGTAAGPGDYGCGDARNRRHRRHSADTRRMSGDQSDRVVDALRPPVRQRDDSGGRAGLPGERQRVRRAESGGADGDGQSAVFERRDYGNAGGGFCAADERGGTAGGVASAHADRPRAGSAPPAGRRQAGEGNRALAEY